MIILIQWTTNSVEEASKVATMLVEQHHVACANIGPDVKSIYFWQGKVEEDQEVKVHFKTVDSKFEQVKNLIKQNTSYDVPEILKINISGGNEEYLQWVQDTIKE